jgi:hypothetical protein
MKDNAKDIRDLTLSRYRDAAALIAIELARFSSAEALAVLDLARAEFSLQIAQNAVIRDKSREYRPILLKLGRYMFLRRARRYSRFPFRNVGVPQSSPFHVRLESHRLGSVFCTLPRLRRVPCIGFS